MYTIKVTLNGNGINDKSESRTFRHITSITVIHEDRTKDAVNGEEILDYDFCLSDTIGFKTDGKKIFINHKEIRILEIEPDSKVSRNY
jgi:hypothetical protein